MYKIVGKHIEKGEFEGRPWQKFVFTCQLTKLSAKYVNAEGIITEQVRAPYNEDFSKLSIGSEVTFLYDKYGKVKSFQKGA